MLIHPTHARNSPEKFMSDARAALKRIFLKYSPATPVFDFENEDYMNVVTAMEAYPMANEDEIQETSLDALADERDQVYLQILETCRAGNVCDEALHNKLRRYSRLFYMVEYHSDNFEDLDTDHGWPDELDVTDDEDWAFGEDETE